MTDTLPRAAGQDLDEPVQVRFVQDKPLAVRWRGRIWPVAADPLRWFTRSEWWNSGLPAGKNAGNLVDVEHWRLQVRLNTASPLRTFEIRKAPGRDDWRLVKVTDEH